MRKIVAGFLFFPLSCLLAAEVSLNVSTSRQKIYLGESFNLNVQVEGADRGVAAPDLSAFSAAEIQFLGSHSNTRSSISIINGRMTRESFEGRTFAYQVTPREKGRFRAGPIRLNIGGKTVAHEGVIIEVAGVEKQDFVLAKVLASSTAVLVEEPFTITLSLAIADLPEPYAAENEPLFPNAPPHVTADFLEINRPLENGLKGPDLNQLLNGIIDQSGRQACFSLNSYQARDMMGFGSLFDDDPFKPRPIRFRLPVVRKKINGKSYREYTLSLNYTATKEGDFTFGPITFKGSIIAGVNQSRQAIPQEIYAIGPAVTVRVTPPPDEGRPECFIGTVGRDVEARAALDATTCKVGDPLTLTLEVAGKVSISNMRTPILGLQPELTKDFRVYDDNVKSETLPNGKRFTYRVRPLREGTLEFPPVKIGYYDSGRRVYEILKTQPIPLQAKATTQIATASASPTEDVVAQKDDEILPCGITVAPLARQNDRLLPTLKTVLSLILVGPLLCFALWVTTPLACLLQHLRERNRTSGAWRRARAGCGRAKDPAGLARVVRTYLAERLGLASGTAVTPGDAYALLVERGVQPDLAMRVQSKLELLDEALYRPDSKIIIGECAHDISEVLALLDKEVERCV